MFFLYKHHSLPTWRNIIFLLIIILICLLATALSPPPFIDYADSPRWYNAWYKDEVAAELNKLGYTNFSWWCAEDRRTKRMEHVPEQYKNDEKYLEKIDKLCDRYNIDDDTERLTRKRDDYWEMIRRSKVAIVIKNIIMRLSCHSKVREEQLSIRNYSVPKEMANCYMRVREIFRVYCVDPDINAVEEHRYVFERICEADWLNHDLIIGTFKDVCEKVDFLIGMRKILT